MSERADDLSSRELELVEAAAEGRVLECSQLYPAQLANTGNPAHVIRAEVLRELLLAQRCMPPDPRGVCLCGARITGSLDLTDLPASVGMELRGCWLDESIVLRDAHMPWLSLSGSRVPALVGDGLRVDGALLLREGFWATGGGRLGAVRLLGARIGGMTDLSDAQLLGQDWPPLIGDGLQVHGDLILRSCRITGRSKFGAIRLPGAHIGGRLDLTNAQLTNQEGATLIGDGLQVDGDLILRSCRVTGRSKFGAVQLPGAHVGGRVDLASAQLAGRDDTVLD